LNSDPQDHRREIRAEESQGREEAGRKIAQGESHSRKSRKVQSQSRAESKGCGEGQNCAQSEGRAQGARAAR